MLTAEDRDVLGMALETPRASRPSAVSQILRALNDDLEHGIAAWKFSGSTSHPAGYNMVVATGRAMRVRAHALAHRVYSSRGYVSAADESPLPAFDGDPRTLTLLAQDDAGHDVGTVSLVFDSTALLPCDEIYSAELAGLRAQGRRMAEVTRLAIDERHQLSSTLLIRLFNFIYIFARRVNGLDDFVIEVNPRHVAYYRRLLGFVQEGPERPCPRVRGAPAVLMRLDLAEGERTIRSVAGKRACSHARSLYPHFYSWLEEGAVAEFLARSHPPMSPDAARFELK